MSEPTSGFVSLEKIKTKLDIAAAILRELETVPKGTLIAEQELCQRAAGQDRNRFRRAVENGEDTFRTRRVRLKLDEGEARWFWGHAEDIAEALKIRDL